MANPLTELEKRIDILSNAEAYRLIANNQLGFEKESLRTCPNGTLSYRPHPKTLGSALTNPCITTDYSEMLLELIVPPHASSIGALDFLTELHAFVHQNLEADELLWASSLPYILPTQKEIPLAQYGTSNMGRMKTIYRSGLGYRYGRTMQTIAGFHFNFSFAKELWPYLSEVAPQIGPTDDVKTFRNAALMGVIRNLMRVSWIIPYLFGASPAICKSFPHLTSKDNALESYDKDTLFGRYATSLRMGDLGYQNNLQTKNRIAASYNSLKEHIASLHHAVTTPFTEYEKIGVHDGTDYQQLSSNILQIENEHYATVRPKCVQQKNQMRLLALAQTGIEYIELRSLDLNTFSPIGFEPGQAHFLEVLFWSALLLPSPPMDQAEQARIHHNEVAVAHQGRNPQLKLFGPNKTLGLAAWGREISALLSLVATLLDVANQSTRYQQSVDKICQLFEHPELTLSQRVLDAMQTNQQSFRELTCAQSTAHHQHFLMHKLDAAQQRSWQELAQRSLQEQVQIEQNETLPLDDFIRTYFAQLQDLPV